MKNLILIATALILASCAPRYGFDPEDPDLLPVRTAFDYANEYRYKSPTRSHIPQNMPVGVLKETKRPPYYFEYDPKDTYKYKQYTTGK